MSTTKKTRKRQPPVSRAPQTLTLIRQMAADLSAARLEISELRREIAQSGQARLSCPAARHDEEAVQ